MIRSKQWTRGHRIRKWIDWYLLATYMTILTEAKVNMEVEVWNTRRVNHKALEHSRVAHMLQTPNRSRLCACHRELILHELLHLTFAVEVESWCCSQVEEDIIVVQQHIIHQLDVLIRHLHRHKHTIPTIGTLPTILNKALTWTTISIIDIPIITEFIRIQITIPTGQFSSNPGTGGWFTSTLPTKLSLALAITTISRKSITIITFLHTIDNLTITTLRNTLHSTTRHITFLVASCACCCWRTTSASKRTWHTTISLW